MAHKVTPASPVSAAPPNPFFVYFCSHHTHVPAFANANITNTTKRGWFGDHLRMLDWSVGEITQAVADAGVEDTTLVLFSADNGPSLMWENLGGNNGAMRCGKGTTWEGGQRVPGIAYWPGTIAPGTTSHDILSTMDFFATALALADVPLPTDRTIDAIDFTPVLLGHVGTRDTFIYWGGTPRQEIGLHAVRKGDWKMHW
jgi:arylsulfatase A